LNQGDKKVSKFRSAFLAVLVLVFALPQSVQSADTPHWVHYKLLKSSSVLPEKVVVLPVSIEVQEVTAGDVMEEVPEWSEEASRNVFESVSAAISKDVSLQEVSVPDLTENTAEVVDEHMALYKLVVNTASDVGWQHKIRRFDYGIGPGLEELQRLTGADAAVMVYGEDYVSTAGRKAKAVAGNIPIVNIFSGPAPALGHSFIHIGVVDLRTGDLLWMNSDYRKGTTSLRNPEDTEKIISSIFDWYPGIEKYRDVYVN
jgi:hypothetical protein